MFDTQQPQNLEQFNIVQQQIYIQNLVNDLTANRALRGKRPQKTEQIILGYNKVMALLDRFKA